MKNIYLILIALVICTTGVRLHSQNKPTESSGAVLLKIKADNTVLIERQTALLKVLELMQADAQQLRIVAKRG